MKNTYRPGRVLLTGTSVTTSATLISGGTDALRVSPGRKLFTFPCEGISSQLFVLPWKAGVAAPSAGQIANGGRMYTADDRMVELELDEHSDVYACTDAGTFPVYETEWV